MKVTGYVQNKGWALEHVDYKDISIPEETRIRGFKVCKIEQVEINYADPGKFCFKSWRRFKCSYTPVLLVHTGRLFWLQLHHSFVHRNKSSNSFLLVHENKSFWFFIILYCEYYKKQNLQCSLCLERHQYDFPTMESNDRNAYFCRMDVMMLPKSNSTPLYFDTILIWQEFYFLQNNFLASHILQISSNFYAFKRQWMNG